MPTNRLAEDQFQALLNALLTPTPTTGVQAGTVNTARENDMSYVVTHKLWDLGTTSPNFNLALEVQDGEIAQILDFRFVVEGLDHDSVYVTNMYTGRLTGGYNGGITAFRDVNENTLAAANRVKLNVDPIVQPDFKNPFGSILTKNIQTATPADIHFSEISPGQVSWNRKLTDVPIFLKNTSGQTQHLFLWGDIKDLVDIGSASDFNVVMAVFYTIVPVSN